MRIISIILIDLNYYWYLVPISSFVQENRNNKQQKTYPNQSPGKSYSNSNDSRNYNRSHNNNNNKSMSSAMPSIFSQAQQQPPPKPASKPVSANSQKDFILNDKTMAAVQRHIKK